MNVVRVSWHPALLSRESGGDGRVFCNFLEGMYVKMMA